MDSLFSTSGGIIQSALKNRQRVQITGFGTFEGKDRKARTGRNPRTGQTIYIAATTTPAFRAGKGLKSSVSGRMEAAEEAAAEEAAAAEGEAEELAEAEAEAEGGQTV